MKLLIYNEDQKVLIKDGELPEIKSDDYEEIKKYVLENFKLDVAVSGKRNRDYMVAKIIKGAENPELIFEDVKSQKYKDLIEADIKYWQDQV